VILKKQYFTVFLQVQPQVELARDNRDRKLPAYLLFCYCSSRSFFAFISFHCAQQIIQETITATQPTTIKMMAASFFLHSIVINFALDNRKTRTATTHFTAINNS
jgi:hypothetical protein